MARVFSLGSTFNTNSGTKTRTVTPSIGVRIIICVLHSGNILFGTPTDDNPDGGGTYALLESTDNGVDMMAVYARNQPIHQAVSTIFTHAPGITTGGGLLVLQLAEVERGGAAMEIQSAQGSGSGGTPTATFAATPLINSPIIACLFRAANPAAVTPRSSPAYTEHVDTGWATPTFGFQAMSVDEGENAAAIAWGATATGAWRVIAVEINPWQGRFLPFL